MRKPRGFTNIDTDRAHHTVNTERTSEGHGHTAIIPKTKIARTFRALDVPRLPAVVDRSADLHTRLVPSCAVLLLLWPLSSEKKDAE